MMKFYNSQCRGCMDYICESCEIVLNCDEVDSSRKDFDLLGGYYCFQCQEKAKQNALSQCRK